MGTNYYRVNIPTEDDIKKMHEMIDERKFESRRGYFSLDGGIIPDDAVTCVTDLIDNCTKEIHICKCSWGWQTSFDHNWGKYYQPNRKSLEEFLKEPNTIIRDEYGEEISFDDFWEMVNTRDTMTFEDGRKPLNSKTYRKWLEEKGEHDELYCREDMRKCAKVFGIPEPEDNDFEVDGLRFCVFSDFS